MSWLLWAAALASMAPYAPPPPGGLRLRAIAGETAERHPGKQRAAADKRTKRAQKRKEGK